MKAALFFLVLYLSYRIAKTYSCKRDVLGHKASDWLASENMPEELAKARLYMNETEIKDITGKTRRVDQVFLTKENILIVVDTKTRNRHSVYASDIGQVSDYVKALRLSEPYPVSDKCYIRTVIIRAKSKSVLYQKIYV